MKEPKHYKDGFNAWAILNWQSLMTLIDDTAATYVLKDDELQYISNLEKFGFVLIDNRRTLIYRGRK